MPLSFPEVPANNRIDFYRVPATKMPSRSSEVPSTRRRIYRYRGKHRIITAIAVSFCASRICSAFSPDYITPHVKSFFVSPSPPSASSSLFFTTTCLRMADTSPEKDPNNKNKDDPNGNEKSKKTPVDDNDDSSGTNNTTSDRELELITRVTNLEQLVAKQAVEIRHLRLECNSLTEAAAAFAGVVDLLRQAGLSADEEKNDSLMTKKKKLPKASPSQDEKDSEKEKSQGGKKGENKVFEYFDDSEIFGTAPSSVIDAADAAGAAILASLLGGKQRMLVDVRDAELSRDQETLVQFIELAILPVAAGLEGLKSTRNRVKIVFPTVSQLLQYRRAMALSAPEVVALSTLGLDPVEKQDNLVVIIAPAPDEEEGLAAMNELLFPSDPNKKAIRQPTVVLNHHMVPVSGPAADFEVAYHLRLLSVQYMTGNNAPEYFSKWEEELKKKMKKKKKSQNENNTTDSEDDVIYGPSASEEDETQSDDELSSGKTTEEDPALEAAMKHAHELGVHQGVTRAMVIRAYPRPWHVFVDTSPDTDADFEVAATFDEEPSGDDVNFAIVECLEGSEREDELVAQQMQQALEDGQLDQVSEMLGISTDFEVDDSEQQSLSNGDDEDDDDDNFYNDFDMFEEDSC